MISRRTISSLLAGLLSSLMVLSRPASRLEIVRREIMGSSFVVLVKGEQLPPKVRTTV